MFSDSCDRYGLTVPPLAPETSAALKASLPTLSSVRNPIDYTAGYPRAGDGLDFQRAFAAAIGDPGVDQLAVMFAAAGRGQLEFGGEVLAGVAANSDKPIIVFSGMTESLAPEGLRHLRAAGIPVLASPRRVAAAMARLAGYAEALARARLTAAAPSAEMAMPDLPSGPASLNEHDSKRVIAAAGLAVTRDRLMPVEPDASAFAGLRFPLALKIVSRDIAHKTDIGAVRLNIADASQLASAAAEIVGHARRSAPEARLDGLLACEMIDDGAEMIVGVVNDSAFGPVVGCGLGGVFAEALRDMTYRIAPFGLDEARAMLGELRGRAIFDGLRGRPALDVAALAQSLVRLSELAWRLRDRLSELDINPLLVRPAGRGVVAADALVVLR